MKKFAGDFVEGAMTALFAIVAFTFSVAWTYRQFWLGLGIGWLLWGCATTPTEDKRVTLPMVEQVDTSSVDGGIVVAPYAAKQLLALYLYSEKEQKEKMACVFGFVQDMPNDSTGTKRIVAVTHIVPLGLGWTSEHRLWINWRMPFGCSAGSGMVGIVHTHIAGIRNQFSVVDVNTFWSNPTLILDMIAYKYEKNTLFVRWRLKHGVGGYYRHKWE